MISRARREAKAQGLKFYNTGRPCKRGHLCDRHVANGLCVECFAQYKAKNAEAIRAYQKEYMRSYERKPQPKRPLTDELRAYQKAYYAANRSWLDGYRKEYYERNRADILEYAAAYRTSNKEKVAAAKARWHYANRDEILAKKAVYTKANRERDRAREARWKKANADRVNAHNTNRKARELGASGSHTEEDILALFADQRGRCALCQSDISKGYHKDHIMPLSKGGSNDKGNLQLLCRPCNLRKGAKVPMRVEG